MQRIESIHRLVPDQLTTRRTSLLPGLLIAGAGIALLLFYFFRYASAPTGTVGWIPVAAFCLLGVGIALGCYALFGDSRSIVHIGSAERMVRSEHFFDRSDSEAVLNAVRSGDFAALGRIPRSTASSVMVVIYAPRSAIVAAAQVFEYVPHEYAPLTSPIYFPEGSFRPFDGLR